MGRGSYLLIDVLTISFPPSPLPRVLLIVLLPRKGSSRLGLFDQETSNHASFLGRTSSVPAAAAGKGGPGLGRKPTFTFSFGGGGSQLLPDSGDPTSSQLPDGAREVRRALFVPHNSLIQLPTCAHLSHLVFSSSFCSTSLAPLLTSNSFARSFRE